MISESTPTPDSPTRELRARITERLGCLAVYRRDADALVPIAAGDLAEARDRLARLESHLALSEQRRERAVRDLTQERRTQGQLRNELERTRDDSLDRVAAAEALAAEAGVAPADVMARVEADRAHWRRQIELRENEISTHQQTIRRLLREREQARG